MDFFIQIAIIQNNPSSFPPVQTTDKLSNAIKLLHFIWG